MSREIRRELRNAAERKCLIALFYNPDDESACEVGLVSAISNTYVQIKAYNMFGEGDGYHVISISSIFNISTGGIYENKINFMIQKDFGTLFEVIEFAPVGRVDIVRHTLQQAMKHRVITRFFNRRDSRLGIGFIETVSRDSVTISSVDEFVAVLDGVDVLLYDQISRFHCDSKEDKMLRILLDEFADHG